NHGDQDGCFLPAQAFKVIIFFVGNITHEHLLIHVKHVDSRQDNTQCRKQGEEETECGAAQRSHQNGEFTDETIQTGQAHAAEGDKKAQTAEYWQHLPDTSISSDFFGVTTFV